MPPTYQQFLRYVVPGLVLFIEIGIVTAIGHTGWRWPLWLWEQISSSAIANVGSAVNLFVLSGGVGFLLSMVHHSLVRRYGPDYRDLAPELRDWEHNLPHHRAVAERLNDNSRAASWLYVTAFWHSYRSRSCMLEKATDRAESLADLLHALGATFVASVAAPVIVLMTLVPKLLERSPEICSGKSLAAAIVAGLLIAFHYWTFRFVAQYTHDFVSGVLRRALCRDASTLTQSR